MNYSAEIANVMKQAHSLGAEIDARRKAIGRDGEYWRFLTGHKTLEHREHDLRRQAAEDFAALNGWRYTPARLQTLVRAGVHDSHPRSPFDYEPDWISVYHQLFDHPLFFREFARPYCTAAIVGQPYDTSADTARAAATEIGLELHVPADINASWWYPGFTRFFWFTRGQRSSACASCRNRWKQRGKETVSR